MECGEARAPANKFDDWTGEHDLAQLLVTELCTWLTQNDFQSGRDELAIVIEDFILRPGPHGAKRSGLSPVRMSMAILIELRGVWLSRIPVTPQMPGQAKGYLTDERLKALGWWVRGKPHSRDALRHLATYVARYRRAGGGRG